MSNRTTLAQLAEMNGEQVANLPTDHIALLLEDAAALKAQAKAADDILTAELDRRFGPRAADVRRASNKDTGTVTLEEDGFKVKADLPKRVTWDQAALAVAVQTVASWGENTSEYVSTKLDVAEKAYSAWPSSIRKLFDPARTVGVGRATYRLERAA